MKTKQPTATKGSELGPKCRCTRARRNPLSEKKQRRVWLTPPLKHAGDNDGVIVRSVAGPRKEAEECAQEPEEHPMDFEHRITDEGVAKVVDGLDLKVFLELMFSFLRLPNLSCSQTFKFSPMQVIDIKSPSCTQECATTFSYSSFSSIHTSYRDVIYPNPKKGLLDRSTECGLSSLVISPRTMRTESKGIEEFIGIFLRDYLAEERYDLRKECAQAHKDYEEIDNLSQIFGRTENLDNLLRYSRCPINKSGHGGNDGSEFLPAIPKKEITIIHTKNEATIHIEHFFDIKYLEGISLNMNEPMLRYGIRGFYNHFQIIHPELIGRFWRYVEFQNAYAIVSDVVGNKVTFSWRPLLKSLDD
ncbi:hypothetical protein JHK87_033713 [Glycine soja]|nr:hypothetical protein JHK87_033713 [Glycine soja]